jgi:glycosyltransferase involved in cell wall biosynthesis
MPEQIYKTSEKSLSGFPIWVEKVFLKLSFFSSYCVITGKNIKIYIDWLSSVNYVKNKLKIIDILVDELPSIDFYASMTDSNNSIPSVNEFIILYVGRLEKDKLVANLIEMFTYIRRSGLKARLQLIGDGSERENLKVVAKKMGVGEEVDFLGFKPSSELVDYYKKADVFVSPLTGTSLREAGLCKAPVVAYNIDWVKGFLVNEENSLLVEPGNTEEMAKQVIRILTDKHLREKIADNFHKLALEWWGPKNIAIAMEQAFGSE